MELYEKWIRTDIHRWEMENTTFLRLKEWIDTIRGEGETSCGIDKGFDDEVTFNLAYENKK